MFKSETELNVHLGGNVKTYEVADLNIREGMCVLKQGGDCFVSIGWYDNPLSKRVHIADKAIEWSTVGCELYEGNRVEPVGITYNVGIERQCMGNPYTICGMIPPKEDGGELCVSWRCDDEDVYMTNDGATQTIGFTHHPKTLMPNHIMAILDDGGYIEARKRRVKGCLQLVNQGGTLSFVEK